MLNLAVKDDKPHPGVICRGMETMGSRIKNLRNAKGMTLKELGDAVGVTKGAVSQWESGGIANIKLPTVLLLCEALGTDLAYLVYGPTRKPVSSSARPKISILA
jgi:transcriptional regulator with XRE-family HTH domain